jgi:hypothetical protein
VIPSKSGKEFARARDRAAFLPRRSALTGSRDRKCRFEPRERRGNPEVFPEAAGNRICVGLGGGGRTPPTINERYEEERAGLIKPGRSVLVGVDDIPARWLVQRASPAWLGIGATTHWSAMASFHEAGLGCAECLHPLDDPSTAAIPTVAFVSFWAGLLLATYFLRQVSGRPAEAAEQQIYMTPFRAENAIVSVVPKRPGCPSCHIIGYGKREPAVV